MLRVSALAAVLLLAIFFQDASAQGKPNLCYLPPRTGLCLAYFPSFYYDSSSGTCRSFVYGGCQGNENRFVSYEECIRACGDQTMKSKKVTPRNADPAAASEDDHRRGTKDLAALLRSTPSRRTRASRKEREPPSPGANVASPSPLVMQGGAQPPLQLQVYSTPFFGQLPVHRTYLMPPPQQQQPAVYAAVGDVRSEGREASASAPAEAEAVLMLPGMGGLPINACPMYGLVQEENGQGAPPGTYSALVATGRHKAALHYSEPSSDATATTAATNDSRGGDVPDAHNVRPSCCCPCDVASTWHASVLNDTSPRVDECVTAARSENRNLEVPLLPARSKSRALAIGFILQDVGVRERSPWSLVVKMSRFAVLAILLVAIVVTGASAQGRPRLCSLPSAQGPCRGRITAFYFDRSSGRCRQFIYGGCQGNANRFKSFRQCARVCG
ncbi:uncharacterized protein [Dermacentor andersoni]|uniref:uncharacterized protein n=1 Tax=Dermacentor andersoni TaxID=34620 RepID=UPI003B3B1BEF